MGDMLGDGARWLAARLAASASVTVGYRRGANTSTLVATIGRSTFEAVNQSGVPEAWESRDYVVQTAQLPYGEPQRGDLVVETVDGVERLYQVASPRGVPVFHWGDAFQATIRIHTKELDREVTILVDGSGLEIAVPLDDPDREVVVPLHLE